MPILGVPMRTSGSLNREGLLPIVPEWPSKDLRAG